MVCACVCVCVSVCVGVCMSVCVRVHVGVQGTSCRGGSAKDSELPMAGQGHKAGH